MLTLAGPQLPDTQMERGELVRHVIGLEPTIDQALGESSRVRYRSSTLQTAVRGLLTALDGWRGVATHLKRLPDHMGSRVVECIVRGIPPELPSAWEPNSAERWMADPTRLQRVCEQAERTLLTLKTDTPSQRLLADETAKVLNGIVCVLDGLALLVDAPGRASAAYREVPPTIPDWIPAVVNGIRACVAVGAVELLWVATAWPNGGLAIVFVAIVVLLLSPKGDLAYHGALEFALATTGSIIAAAIIKFAVLPAFETFAGFCAAIGLFLIPVGFAMARSRMPALMTVFGAMGVNFAPLLSPTNPMIYDTAQFYNTALAVFVGCAIAPLVFRLLPPLSPALRARRLLALTLRDLRRLAVSPLPPQSVDWGRRMYDRLAALPDDAEPLQLADSGGVVGRE